jgi:hypothetical protein
LLAQRAAVIQFSLPINRSCLSARCGYCQDCYRAKNSLHHVQNRWQDGPANVSKTSEAKRRCPKPPVGERHLGGDVKPRDLAGNADSAASYCAPSTSACRARDADRRQRSPVSSATETTASCDTCIERGTAQSIVLPISVIPMIVSFFMISPIILFQGSRLTFGLDSCEQDRTPRESSQQHRGAFVSDASIVT